MVFYSDICHLDLSTSWEKFAWMTGSCSSLRCYPGEEQDAIKIGIHVIAEVTRRRLSSPSKLT